MTMVLSFSQYPGRWLQTLSNQRDVALENCILEKQENMYHEIRTLIPDWLCCDIAITYANMYLIVIKNKGNYFHGRLGRTYANKIVQ